MSNREALIERLMAMEEKRKRDLLKRPPYVPNEGQLPVHKSEAKDRFIFSGNGAGKTALLVNEIIWAMKGLNPLTGKRSRVPARIIMVVDTSRKIEERIIPEFRKWTHVEDDWLKRMGRAYTARIQMDNGSICDFYSADADPASFEGVEASHVFVDEPIPRPLYVALKRSLRLKHYPCRFLFCGTAVSEAWLRKDVYEPWAKGELDEVECFRVGSDVNKEHLQEGYLESFGKSLSEAEREVRLKGGFFDSDALALAHLWDRKVHVVSSERFKYDKTMPCVVAIDCHSVKPHTAILITADKSNRIYAVKELCLRSTATQFAQAMKQWMADYRVVDVVVDSLGSMEGTSMEGFTSFIDGLNRAGIRARATRYEEKNHEALIERLREGLVLPTEPDNFGAFIPKLRFLDTCRGLINDIETVGWQRNRATGEMKPILDTSTQDFLAPFGYALATNLFYKRTTLPTPYRDDRMYYGVKSKPTPYRGITDKYKR